MYRKLALVLLFSCSLTGCETLVRAALEGASDSKIRYGSQCESLRMQCRAADYSEWETSAGKRGCSCADSSNQSRYPADMPGAM